MKLPPHNIEYRKYKNSDEDISLLGFGGLRLPRKKGSNEIDTIAAQEMVDYAILHGINYFDTAYAYGKSELFFGEALSKHPRASFNLATKMPLAMLKSIGDVERIFDEQLQRCRVAYFDFYLLHNINKTDWHVIETYKVYDFLKEKKQQGLIRRLGFSFHDKPELLTETVNAYQWDFAQIQLNYMDWELQNAKRQYEILKEKNIPIIVMEPVRGGTLATLSKNAVNVFKEARPEASAASWALRYAASFPEVLTVLSGMSDMNQLQDNIHTVEHFKPLEPAENEVIQKALAVYTQSGAVPCTGCRYCMECPAGVDIPSVFAVYNTYRVLLAEQKRRAKNDFRFRYTILREGKQAHHCVKCRRCVKRCPQHIDIPYWLDSIAAISRKIGHVSKVRKLLSKIKQKIKRT